MRVDVRPELLRWARARAGKDLRTLTRRFPRLAAWEEATSRPTLKQLERFARATYTPIGYFFLPVPPDEPVPIPDFRTIGDAGQPRPSADLLDTIYVCQQRQEWYRDFAQVEGASPLAFVGSTTLDSDVVETAAQIRTTLGFSVEERQTLPSWTEALRRCIGQAETSGFLVMVSGVVGTNTSRKLSGPGHNYGDAPRAARRPADKARRPRILNVFERGATQSPGMHRRSNAAKIIPGTT